MEYRLCRNPRYSINRAVINSIDCLGLYSFAQCHVSGIGRFFLGGTSQLVFVTSDVLLTEMGPRYEKCFADTISSTECVVCDTRAWTGLDYRTRYTS